MEEKENIFKKGMEKLEIFISMIKNLLWRNYDEVNGISQIKILLSYFLRMLSIVGLSLITISLTGVELIVAIIAYGAGGYVSARAIVDSFTAIEVESKEIKITLTSDNKETLEKSNKLENPKLSNQQIFNITSNQEYPEPDEPAVRKRRRY